MNSSSDAPNAIPSPSTSVRLAMRPDPFALLFIEDAAVTASLMLDGSTVGVAEQWVRRQLADRGIDAGRYILDKHYTIPSHPVASGAPFRITDLAAFAMLSSWFADAAAILEQLAEDVPNASEVRCWPHHFDIATLIALTPATAGAQPTLGIGMDPGDEDYREPYFYVNRTPAVAGVKDTLDGNGLWHTDAWVGAVLPGSRVTAVADDQRSQIRQFIDSALRASTAP